MWDIDARDIQEPYEYSDDAIPSASKIFMSVCMDRLWANQQSSDTPMFIREAEAEAMGRDLRRFFRDHLGVDSHDFYKK
jgi:hypothetical protein